MLEVLRFGFAWVAILVLAGITSVPPEADEFPCCQTTAEQPSLPFCQWISNHFKGYAPKFLPLLGTNKAPGKQPCLCTKTESGAWARVIGENRPRPNGIVLSILCEAYHHTFRTMDYISGGQTWEDALEALEIMTGEVIQGVWWTASKLAVLSLAAVEAGVDVAKDMLPAPLVEKMSGLLSRMAAMDLANIALYALDIMATYFLELTLTDIVMFLWSLKNPAVGMTCVCGSLVGAAFTKVGEAWVGFAALVDAYSGGRMYHVPLFHSGFGIFTLIPQLLAWTYACSHSAVLGVVQMVTSFDSRQWMFKLKEMMSYISEIISSGLGDRRISDVFLEYFESLNLRISRLWVQLPALLQTNIVQKCTAKLGEAWAVFVTLDPMHYMALYSGTSFLCFGTSAVSALVAAVVDMLAVTSHFVWECVLAPTSTVLVNKVSQFWAQFQIQSLGSLAKRLGIIALHWGVGAAKWVSVLVQKVGGLRTASQTGVVDGGGPMLHWGAIYRMAGLVGVGALVVIVTVLYKYKQVSGPRRDNRQALSRPEAVTYPTANNRQAEPSVKGVLKTIGEHFIAIRRMKSGPNFHFFQMESKESKSQVCLKCLRSGASRRAKISLAKECRATRALQHPHIVKFVRWLRVGSFRALALEYTPHGDLRVAMVSGATFTLHEKLAVFRQILAAVMFVHAARAAHLNVRPGSVLVFNQWKNVKLSGFGHVVKVSEDQVCREYNLHHVAGPTEALIRQQPYNPYKADAWALGSFFFFLITEDFLHKKTNVPLPAILLPALRECDIRYQKAILVILTSLLCYDPKGRPDLAAVLDSLDNLEK